MPRRLVAEEKIAYVILHGLGVEGRAALDWFLANTVAQLYLVDTVEAFQKLPPEIQSNSRIHHFTESTARDFQNTNQGNTLYLRSPGVSPTNELVQLAQSAQIPITTPTGYWLARHAPEKTITITGTKGKSTAAELTAHLLAWCDVEATLYGNIGKPPLGLSDEPQIPDRSTHVAIVELSSYMMHDLPTANHFHVITNLYKEHTDWHGSFDAYSAAKLNPFTRAPATPGLAPKEIAKHLPTRSKNLTWFEDIVPLQDGTLTIGSTTLTPATLNEAFAAPSMLLALRNAIAISLATHLASAERIIEALTINLPAWKGLPARQEIVSSTDDVTWVNDTLATIPEATLSALARWSDHHIHLLLGGKDRGQDFTALMKQCAKRKNLHIYAFSETAPALENLAEDLGIATRLQRFENLESMIAGTKIAAAPGHIILFSPAAPSAPPHANFEVRSDIFRAAAHDKA